MAVTWHAVAHVGGATGVSHGLLAGDAELVYRCLFTCSRQALALAGQQCVLVFGLEHLVMALVHVGHGISNTCFADLLFVSGQRMAQREQFIPPFVL